MLPSELPSRVSLPFVSTVRCMSRSSCESMANTSSSVEMLSFGLRSELMGWHQMVGREASMHPARCSVRH